MPRATSQWSATVGATDIAILGVNPSRLSLTIAPPSAGRVTIAFGRAAVLDAGITIQTATQPITLDYAEVGDQLCGEIRAIADAAARTIGGVESFEPRF